ncbi:hypothetical protein QBC42DRAFT_81167 [Cladorrhinum samala]|uniref:Nicotinamide-nucleotide adenylyltransferase n=1 Tax=Cladorrhinum samala TaxID=585594 RepID=A0AAV9HS68_9PEZI|nr:hypothetical protein QBC42DRAFT_81167 [Cladorrhinum samala]
MSSSENPPTPGDSLTAMRSRFFSEALASFQASSSKFRVISTAGPTIALRTPGSRVQDEHSPSPAIPPSHRPRSLVVLDSSFNPPTNAHLRMASSAIFDTIDRSPPDLLYPHSRNVRLLLVLSINNADKAPKPAGFHERLSMMWSFARDVQQSLSVGQPGGEIGAEGLIVDIALSTLPYFHGKSQAIAEDEFYQGTEEAADQGRGQTEQVILAGYDTLIRIFDPKYYHSEEGNGMRKALGPMFDRATLRVTMRTNDQWGDATEQRQYLKSLFKPDQLKKVGADGSWESKIELVDGPTLTENVVSSTYAREAAKEGDYEKLKKLVPPRVRECLEGMGIYRD